MPYRDLSQDALERNYSPRLAVPAFQTYLDRFAARSAAARPRLAGHWDLRYGPGPLQTLDFFPAADRAAATHVFVHGGYWRALDKSEYLYVAETLSAAGASVGLLNYDLCPAVTLDRLVEEMAEAMHWLSESLRRLGGNPERLYLSGHSAGAHLVAMLLARDWAADGLPADVIKGAVAVSGIYELDPVPLLAVNAEIGLTPEQAVRNSPMRHPPGGPSPLVVAVGGAETPEWIRQSADYARLCRDRGVPCEYHLIPGENHFSVVETLADPASPLSRLLLGQMGL